MMNRLFVRFPQAAAIAIAAMLALLLSAPPATAAEVHYGDRHVPRDPLFNLPYIPSQVHFDSISVADVGECAPLLGSLGQGAGGVRLFGQLVTGVKRVVVLGDEDVNAPRGLSGVVLVIRGNNCRSSGPLLALRRTPVADPDLDPGLSAGDVSMLLRDMLVRYARAFGSRAAFLGWADRLTDEAADMYQVSPGMPCPLLYTSMFSPQMRGVLDQFRGS